MPRPRPSLDFGTPPKACGFSAKSNLAFFSLPNGQRVYRPAQSKQEADAIRAVIMMTYWTEQVEKLDPSETRNADYLT